LGLLTLSSPVKDTVVCETLPIVSSAQQIGVAGSFAFTPNQIIMSCGAKVWQGEALGNMPTFRIRMARKLFTTVWLRNLGMRNAVLNLRVFPPRFAHNG